jgi:hypothetical protein
VKPTVAVCKSCGAVLDREKALALGLVPPPAEPHGAKSPDVNQGRSAARRQ